MNNQNPNHPPIVPPQQPDQLNYNQPPSPANRQSQKDILFNHIHQALAGTYDVYQNRHGTTIFVDKITRHAYLPDEESIKNTVINRLAGTIGKEPPKNTIQTAINAAKGMQGKTPINGYLYQRVVQDNGLVSIVCSKSGLVLYIAGNILPSFYGLPGCFNSSGLQQHPNFAPPHYISSGKEEPILTPDQFCQPDFGALFDITNLPRERFYMILAWLVLALLPDRRQVALQLTGDALAGKTRAQKALQNLIDPNDSIIHKPRTHKDVYPRLMETYVPILDDVEELKPDAQIMLAECLDTLVYDLSPKRKEGAGIDITRPLLINSLESVVTEGQLAKKTITIELSETEDEGEDVQSDIVPGNAPLELVQAFKSVLQVTHIVLAQWNAPWQAVDGSYELQDYYHVGHIIGKHFGKRREDGTWTNPFHEEIQRHHEAEQYRSMQEDSVALAVYSWVQHNPGEMKKDTLENWRKLLYRYSQQASDWPANAKQMSRQLRRHKRLLNLHGIQLKDHGRSGPNYFWSIGSKEAPSKEGQSGGMQ